MWTPLSASDRTGVGTIRNPRKIVVDLHRGARNQRAKPWAAGQRPWLRRVAAVTPSESICICTNAVHRTHLSRADLSAGAPLLASARLDSPGAGSSSAHRSSLVFVQIVIRECDPVRPPSCRAALRCGVARCCRRARVGDADVAAARGACAGRADSDGSRAGSAAVTHLTREPPRHWPVWLPASSTCQGALLGPDVLPPHPTGFVVVGIALLCRPERGLPQQAGALRRTLRSSVPRRKPRRPDCISTNTLTVLVVPAFGKALPTTTAIG